MRPSLRLFIGVYLLLSAAVYLAIAIVLDLGWEALPGMAEAAGINCLLQVLFAATAGSLRYLGRMATWRLLLCAAFTAALLAAQATGLVWTLDELLKRSPLPDEDLGIKLLALGSSAALWLLWRWCARQDRLVVVRRLVMVPAAMAAIQLLPTVWAYRVIMARTHGGFLDLTGLETLMAILFDVLVLAWALGAGMVWLYYRGVRRRMRGMCPACGYELRGLSAMRCPECGRVFTPKEVHATAAELAMPRE